VLRSLVRGLVFTATLGGLYGVLYVLVRTEESSLLMGSVALFVILAAVMIGTRKVDCTASRRRSARDGIVSRLDQTRLRLELRLVRLGEDREQVLDAADRAEMVEDRGVGEAAVDDVVDEAQQLLPVAGDVDDDDRLVVEAELLPGDDLEGLVERAEAAGSTAKASDISNMRCLRSCMLPTTISSLTPLWPISASWRCAGMMPMTRPPASSAALATRPIRPIRPPP